LIKKVISAIKNWIRPVYYFVKDNIDYKSIQLVKRNSELNNKYLGEKCFLLLTGDSINMIDLSKLKGQLTFGVNWSFINNEIMEMGLSFYLGTMFQDSHYLKTEIKERYWPKEYWNPQDVHKRIKDMLLINGTKVFFKADDFRFIRKEYEYNINEPNLHFLKYSHDFNLKNQSKIILNERFSVFPEGGSFFTSILILIAMGFKQIYLCGAGYSYEPIWGLHFYDNYIYPKSLGRLKTNQKLKHEIEKRNKSMNSNLEIHGIYEHNDYYRAIIGRYTEETKDNSLLNNHGLINKFSQSKDVQIINILPDGFKSPIFNSISWDELKLSL